MIRTVDVSALLRRSPVFGVLEEGERAALVEAGTSLQRRSGQEIFRVGDPCDAVLVLLRGQVRLWRLTRSGHVLVLRGCRPGEILGQMSVLDGSAHSVNASADGEVALLRLAADRFRSLLERDPRVAVRLCTVLAERVRELSDELEAMKFSSIGERLLRLLQERAAGRRELHVTHQALAEQVGATRENVTRVLGFLRDQGILALRRSAIEVLDHERLLAARFAP